MCVSVKSTFSYRREASPLFRVWTTGKCQTFYFNALSISLRHRKIQDMSTLSLRLREVVDAFATGLEIVWVKSKYSYLMLGTSLLSRWQMHSRANGQCATGIASGYFQPAFAIGFSWHWRLGAQLQSLATRRCTQVGEFIEE